MTANGERKEEETGRIFLGRERRQQASEWTRDHYLLPLLYVQQREAGDEGGERGRGTTTTATTTSKGTGNKSASSLAECLPPLPPFRPPSPHPSLLSPLAKVSFIFCRCFPSSYLALLPWTHTLCYIRGDYTHSHAPLPSPPAPRIQTGQAIGLEFPQESPPPPPRSRRSSNYRRNPSSSWCFFLCTEGALKVVESRGRKRSRGSPPPMSARPSMYGREGRWANLLFIASPPLIRLPPLLLPLFVRSLALVHGPSSRPLRTPFPGFFSDKRLSSFLSSCFSFLLLLPTIYAILSSFLLLLLLSHCTFSPPHPDKCAPPLPQQPLPGRVWTARATGIAGGGSDSSQTDEKAHAATAATTATPAAASSSSPPSSSLSRWWSSVFRPKRRRQRCCCPHLSPPPPYATHPSGKLVEAPPGIEGVSAAGARLRQQCVWMECVASPSFLSSGRGRAWGGGGP